MKRPLFNHVCSSFSLVHSVKIKFNSLGQYFQFNSLQLQMQFNFKTLALLQCSSVWTLSTQSTVPQDQFFTSYHGERRASSKYSSSELSRKSANECARVSPSARASEALHLHLGVSSRRDSQHHQLQINV